MGIILEASHLTYGYDESSHAIEDLSIAFEEGKTTAILGANGAGKSTLFLHLNGILQPEQGEVRFRGQPISYKKAGLRQLRSKVGIVFQNPDDQLFSASVYQDISFGAVNMGLPVEEVHRRVETVMEQVGITYLKDRPTHALSFGQKKRVAFAGIMVMQPEVIILDEPTAGLDPKGRDEILDQVAAFRKETGMTVILVSHSMEDIASFADKILVMSNSRLFCYDETVKVFARSKEISEIGLDVPQITKVFEKLKDRGLDFGKDVYTVEYAKNLLLKKLRGGTANC